MTNHECPLSARPLDWPGATDEELYAALQSERLLNPFFVAYVLNDRPQVMRRALLTHEARGGMLGKPAKKWLGRTP